MHFNAYGATPRWEELQLYLTPKIPRFCHVFKFWRTVGRNSEHLSNIMRVLRIWSVLIPVPPKSSACNCRLIMDALSLYTFIALVQLVNYRQVFFPAVWASLRNVNIPNCRKKGSGIWTWVRYVVISSLRPSSDSNSLRESWSIVVSFHPPCELVEIVSDSLISWGFSVRGFHVNSSEYSHPLTFINLDASQISPFSHQELHIYFTDAMLEFLPYYCVSFCHYVGGGDTLASTLAFQVVRSITISVCTVHTWVADEKFYSKVHHPVLDVWLNQICLLFFVLTSSSSLLVCFIRNC